VPLFRGKKKIDYISLVKAASPYAYYPLTEAAGSGTAYNAVAGGQNFVIGATVVKPTVGTKMGGGFANSALPVISISKAVASPDCVYDVADTSTTALHTMLRGGTSAAPTTYEMWLHNLGGFTTGTPTYGSVFSCGKGIIGAQFNKSSATTLNIYGKNSGGSHKQAVVTIPTNVWFHLVVIVQIGATPDVRIWINGVEDTGSPMQDIDSFDTSSSPKGMSLLGTIHNAGLDNNSTTGYGAIAHVAFYNKALTAQEIALHYEYGKNG
jgi:hypothetical protein